VQLRKLTEEIVDLAKLIYSTEAEEFEE